MTDMISRYKKYKKCAIPWFAAIGLEFVLVIAMIATIPTFIRQSSSDPRAWTRFLYFLYPIVPIAAASLGLWIAMLVQIFSFPDPHGWPDLQSDKTLWGIVAIVFPLVGISVFLAKAKQYASRDPDEFVRARPWQPVYPQRPPVGQTPSVMKCENCGKNSFVTLRSDPQWLVLECAGCKAVHRIPIT